MKRIALLLLASLCATPAPSQHLTFKFGTPFRRTDLDVRWNVATNQLPPQVWIYRLLPRRFPQGFVSNLVALGGFTGKDMVRSNENDLIYDRPYVSCLGISSRLGAIEFRPQRPHYGPTNLAQHVPEMSDLPGTGDQLPP